MILEFGFVLLGGSFETAGLTDISMFLTSWTVFVVLLLPVSYSTSQISWKNFVSFVLTKSFASLTVISDDGVENDNEAFKEFYSTNSFGREITAPA